jgi:anaerobic selenocysteine-containing dehydrogenase
MLHPDDLTRFGFKDGDRVTVHGPAGSMHRIRATEFPTIKPGNAAMYYPEANILIGRAVDPLSRTPVFKNVCVQLGV